MNSTPTVMLAGNSSWLNRGCEAIEVSIRGMLSARLRRLEYVVMPFADGDPRELDDEPGVRRCAPVDFSAASASLERVRRTLSRRIGVPPLQRSIVAPYRSFDEDIRAADALIQIGGDNFTLDYGRPDRFFALNDRARRADVPVVIWGATIGPFSSDPAYERAAARLLERVDLVICRDRESVEYLRSLGVSDNVHLAMDPAFTLQMDDPVIELGDLAQTVAVNVSPLYARYAGISENELIDATREIVSGVMGTHAVRVLLMPHVLLPGQDDHRFLERVRQGIRDGVENVELVPRECGARQLKWIASRCRTIIAARTHLTIAGFSTGVPTISLAYSAKAGAINDEVYGHRRWVVEANHFSSAEVLRVLDELESEHTDTRAQLLEAVGRHAESSKTAADLVCELIAR